MTRKTFKMLLVALVAVLSLGSIAEASSPNKPVRHRTRRSSRVLSGTTQSPKKSVKGKARHKTTGAVSASTRSKSKASKSRAGVTATRRAPSTKPR